MQRYAKTTEIGWDYDGARAVRDSDTGRALYVGIAGSPGSVLVSRAPQAKARPRSATRARASEPKATPKPEKKRRAA